MRGIDYGLGKTNVDQPSGIRYGVISPHSVSPESSECIWRDGENLTHKAAIDEQKASIRAALDKALDDLLPSEWFDGHKRVERLDQIVDVVWEEIADDFNDFNDGYQGDEDHYRYAEDGYVVETSSLGLFVTKSPYYTLAAFCSPCAPGAGDLDAACEDGVKTYCLGHDWFDNEIAPYRVWSVESGEELRRP